MAEVAYLPDDHGDEGRPPGWRGRRVLAAALVVLVAVSGLLIQASAQKPPDEKRRAPRVLSPVESSVGFARVRARGYLIVQARADRIIYYLEGDQEKGVRADLKLVPVRLDKLSEQPNVRLAEQVMPVRMAIIAASFPFRAEVEEFRAALRLRSDAAVLEEQGEDGMPTFRFLGVGVERRTLGVNGKPQTPWAAVDVATAYKPLLLLSGKRFEPEGPRLGPVIFPGLVMPRLKVFGEPDARDKGGPYPAVEARLTQLQKALKELPSPAAGPPPPGGAEEVDLFKERPPGLPAAAGAAPGIAKPGPVPPGVAKPRKTPPLKEAKAPDKPLALPPLCLMRVLDVTVKPGHVYQYRLQVRMANPNYRRKDVAPELARDREVHSAWYEVPQKVVVPPELLYYAVDQKELDGNRYSWEKRLNWDKYLGKDKAVLQIHRWLEGFTLKNTEKVLPVGEWVIAERVIASRGEYVGHDQRIEFPYWRPTMEQFVIASDRGTKTRGPGVPVSFRPDRPDGRDTLLVDFEGGRQAYRRAAGPGVKREVEDASANELLLLTPDGQLLARDGVRDGRDRQRKERLMLVRERLRVLQQAARKAGGAFAGGP